MKGKKILSSILAFGIALSTLSGITTVQAAADTVTIKPKGASAAVVLNGGNPTDGDGIATFANDTITFNKDVELEANGVSGTYGTCISATSTGTKTLTINIPTGITVTMDNTATASGWSTALNGTSTGDLTITGGGTLIVKGGGSDGAYGITPYGKAITIDGTVVKTTGVEYGVGYYSGGSLTIKNGGALVAKGAKGAFETASVAMDADMKVYAGTTAADAAEATVDAIASNKYVKIYNPETTGDPDPDTGENPDPDPDPEPVVTHSDWIGIQTEKNGSADWYYSNHYLMPDGKHYNANSNPYPDFIKGMEVMYYNADEGIIDFNKDITLYGLSGDLSKYYGAAIVPNLALTPEPSLTIRLNNNANVTIDATNREASAYLYGLYSTGHLVIEGTGTLRIKSDKGISDNAALCVYSGNTGELRASLTIKDNVHLILENTDENGYGMNVYGASPGIGDITIQDNAVVEMTGGKAAVNKTPVISGEQKVFVGASKADTQEWDGETDISTYKYVKVAEETEKPEPTDPPEPPDPTEPPEPTPDPTPEPEKTLPKSGLVFFDDYESVPAYDWQDANIATMRKVNGGKYNNIFRMQIDTADGHGKVLKMPTNIGDAVGFYYGNKDLFDLEEAEDVNSGIFVISNDIFIPSDVEFVGSDTMSAFMMTYSAKGWNDGSSKEQAYLYEVRVESGASNGKIIFGDGGEPFQMPVESANNAKTLAFDKWHNIATVIDYESGIVSYYVDGEWITTSNAKAADIKKYFSMSYITFLKGGKYSTSTKPVTFLFDNFKLEYDSEELGAEVTENGSDYVDVKFAKPVDVSKGVSVKLASLDGGSDAVSASGYSVLGIDTVRFQFGGDAILSGKAYELLFDSAVNAAYGNGSVKSGSGLFFNAAPDKQMTTLIDMDFSDVVLNAENSATFKDFVLTHQNADNSAFEDEAGSTYKYAAVKDGVLEYDHYCDVAGQERNGLKFPFTDSAGNPVTISKGVINVEFDAGVKGDPSRTRALFGLNDPQKTDSTWTAATVFGGIAPYDGNKLSFTKPIADNRNKLDTDSSLADTVALNYIGEMHHYKYVIDLDNNSYQIYYDGSLMADLDYIPGGAADNSFDAFVMSAVYAKGGVADSGQTFLMLDNLQVTAEVLNPAVRGLTFVKYDNTEKAYSRVVSAGTKKIKIAFSKEMDADIINQISVTGMDAEDYTVSYANKIAVVEFSECLAPSASYQLTVSADAKDTNQNTIGTEIAYSFVSDAGEIVYGKPVIKVNGTAVSELGTLSDTDKVTVEVSAVNTTAEDSACWISIAGYSNDGYLTSIQPVKETAAASKISVVTVEGDISTLKDADEIGVFVFDDFTNIRPLTECTKIKK